MATQHGSYDRELELLFADTLTPEEEQELANLSQPTVPASADDSTVDSDLEDLADLFN